MPAKIAAKTKATAWIVSLNIFTELNLLLVLAFTVHSGTEKTPEPRAFKSYCLKILRKKEIRRETISVVLARQLL
jgi:hypothetical protein